MKAILLYAAAILGSHLLYRVSELWYGAEWIFGLLAVGWFALFLQAWKRIQPGGAGVIVVTVFMLLDIASIFFVQNLPAAICSLMAGCLLIPFFRKHQDVAITSMGFVLLSVLMSIEAGSFTTLWMFLIVHGTLAIIGFRCRFLWLKRCFTVLFVSAIPVLLLYYLYEGTYLLVFLILFGTFAVAFSSYKFSRQPLL